jgi:hypothetical protein
VEEVRGRAARRLWSALASCLLGFSPRCRIFDQILPSARPFMTSGRFPLGALPRSRRCAPGLDALLPARAPLALRFAVLIALVAALTLGEISLSAPAFASAWNWFHMLG